jgi:hypothetical protein
MATLLIHRIYVERPKKAGCEIVRKELVEERAPLWTCFYVGAFPLAFSLPKREEKGCPGTFS